MGGVMKKAAWIVRRSPSDAEVLKLKELGYWPVRLDGLVFDRLVVRPDASGLDVVAAVGWAAELVEEAACSAAVVECHPGLAYSLVSLLSGIGVKCLYPDGAGGFGEYVMVNRYEDF